MIKGFGIVSGGIQPETATSVAQILDTKIKKVELKKFPNGERYARLDQSVRNEDLYICSICVDTEDYTINDALMEALIIIDAARRASAKSISVIMPLFPYARQDRKAKIREPITAALILSTLERAGVDRIITVDLHSTQIQAAFSGPFENISATGLMVQEIENYIKSHHEDCMIVAPDAGSIKHSSNLATKLGLELAFLPKIRDSKDSSIITRPQAVNHIDQKTCFIIDDMIDSGGTIISAAEVLKKSGAGKIIVCATHGIFSGEACEKIKKSSVDLVVTTDSVPQKNHQKILGKKLKVTPIANLLADAIKSIHSDEKILNID